MIFPEIAERARKAIERFNSKPIALDLKGVTGFTTGDYYARNGFRNLAEAYAGSGPSWSGESVTLETAQTHSVVWTCKRIIAESTGFLPLNMMRRDRKTGETQEANDKPISIALHDGTSDLTAQDLRETMTGHCVLGGNAYAYIMRRSGSNEAQELIPIMPSGVTPDREKFGNRRRVYVVKEGNSQSKTYTVEPDKPQDLLHVRGIGDNPLKGDSVISQARHSIGSAIAAERHAAKFYARGGRLPYVIKMEQPFETTELAQQFRVEWNKLYSDPEQNPILEPMIKEYQQIGLNSKDAQLLETRQYTVPEICRWFRISPHLAGDLTHATFSNIEHLGLEFVNYTLIVWLKRWEQNLWRCVLTPQEQTDSRYKYYFKINANALLRGDFEARMRGYSQALQNAVLNPNECRILEDRDPYDGGDEYHIQLNMQANPVDPNQQPPQRSLVRVGSAAKQQKAAAPLVSTAPWYTHPASIRIQ